MRSVNVEECGQRFLIVIGTRPEAIKLAPVARLLRSTPGISLEVCVTSQHRDLVAPVLNFFRVATDYDLGVGTTAQTPSEVTMRVTQGVSKILSERPYHRVIVQGDTSSALGGGLAGFYQRVPVAHVEAGLRSGDPLLPFPEEGHRRMLDALAQDLFVPTREAFRNLVNEGLPSERIHLTGNTVIDALQWAREELRRQPRPLPFEAAESQKLVLLTTHRRESFGAPMRRILSAVRELARRNTNLLVLFPVHPNPQVREAVDAELGREANVILTKPMDYPDFVQVLLRADLVMTDSGGLQEEAAALGKPILILRDNTERPEGVEFGLAELVGSDVTRIIAAAERRLQEPTNRQGDSWVGLYGDGHASEQIRDVLLGPVQGLKIAA